MSSKECRSKDPAHCKYHGVAAQLNSLQEQLSKTKDIESYSKLTEQIAKTQAQTDAEGRSYSHGEWVLKGEYLASDFIKTFNQRVGTQSYYTGTWEDLQALTKANQHNSEPGTGSKDGDVMLINVPPAGFHTSITEITEENKHLVEKVEHVRMEGEKPVTMQTVKGIKPPATHVQIVCYRADVLAQDDGRSNDAEWEIIAINAQQEKTVPMHPTTMLRNSNHDEGGTLREYTDKEWSDSHAYWDNHAYIDEQD